MAPQPYEQADRAAELIARNGPLLALAEETRAWAREAIERAQDTVLSMLAIRLAWAWEQQRCNDPPPDLP